MVCGGDSPSLPKTIMILSRLHKSMTKIVSLTKCLKQFVCIFEKFGDMLHKPGIGIITDFWENGRKMELHFLKSATSIEKYYTWQVTNLTRSY